ncbi:ClpP/crotonase-like domain-containing protein [Ochromonadaceae sp. CCMP2298]|nr:ClpP/crotonase-like domain-containing protein [Ochromonadaceae sp. CCMP2298]
MLAKLVKILASFVKYLLSFFGFCAKAEKSPDEGYKNIIVDYVGEGVVKLILNRPRKKNAFSKKMYAEISHALNAFSADASVKVVMITGAGDFYSSGNDLSNFSQLMHPLSMAKAARHTCDTFVSSFINIDKPLIAVVNGPAIGIAATTLGLCDRVYASDKAYFKTPFAELAQSPEGCSSYTFPSIMGEAVAHEVLWESRQLSAREAADIKFVYKVGSAGEIEVEAMAYCKTLAADTKDPAAQRWVTPELKLKLQAVNQEELDVLQRKWISSECFVALASFLEKKNMKVAALMLRLANWTGPLWGQPAA